MHPFPKPIAMLLAFVAIVVSGCGRIRYEILAQNGSDGGTTDAARIDDASVAMTDANAPMDAAAMNGDAAFDTQTSLCISPLLWHTDFDRDPALEDNNQDGVADWSWMRSAPSLPERFHDGAWHPVGIEILDTRPLRDWNTRTAVHVRMQNISTDFTQPNPWGALLWLNLNNEKTNVLAVYLTLTHIDSGGQTLRLRRNGSAPDLITVEGLPDRLIDIRLDVDPVLRIADLWVDDAFIDSVSLPDTPGNSHDPFATIATFRGPSIFDSITLVSCQ
jgi:hypothetical protein